MLIHTSQAARELIHEAKMAKLVPADGMGIKADYPKWMKEQCRASYETAAANLVPVREKKAKDDLGRKVSAVAVKPGEVLYAPEGIERFGPGRGQAIEPGSKCVVQDVRQDSMGYRLILTFTDESTGEVVEGYLYETFKLRHWPAASNNGVEGEAL